MTGPWPGQIVRTSCGVGQRVQPVERVEVGAELAVGVGDDGGAAAQHRVAGEQRSARPAAGTTASRRCGRAWRPPGAPARRRRRRRRRRAALGVEAVRRVERAHAAAHALRELRGRLGVVEVVVGQQHHARPRRLLGDRVEVAASIGPGSTTTDRRRAGLAQDPRVGAVERHQAGVRREHAARPLAERAAGPGLMSRVRAPPGAAAGRASTASNPRPAARRPGVNMSTSRPGGLEHPARGRRSCRPQGR